MTRPLRNAFIYVVIMVAVLVLLFALQSRPSGAAQIPLTQLARQVEAGEVLRIRLQAGSNRVGIDYKPGHVPPTAESATPEGSLTEAFTYLNVPPESIRQVEIVV